MEYEQPRRLVMRRNLQPTPAAPEVEYMTTRAFLELHGLFRGADKSAPYYTQIKKACDARGIAPRKLPAVHSPKVKANGYPRHVLEELLPEIRQQIDACEAAKRQRREERDRFWREQETLAAPKRVRVVTQESQPQVRDDAPAMAFAAWFAEEFPEATIKATPKVMYKFKKLWDSLGRTRKELISFLDICFDDWTIVADGFNEWCEARGMPKSRLMQRTPNWPDLTFRMHVFLRHFDYQVGLVKTWGRHGRD